MFLVWTSPLPTSATEWVIRANTRRLSWRERRAFARWLAEDPRRVREVEEAHAAWRTAGGLATSQIAHDHLADSLRQLAAAQKTAVPHRIALPIGIAAAACIALIVMLVPDGGPQGTRLAEDADVRTNVGEVARYVLPDESAVTVGANAVMHIAFADGLREMELDRGEAFFEVTPGREAPFVVNAGSREVMVTGTKFNVDYNPTENALEVAVAEGSVNVTLSQGDNAGSVVRVQSGEVMFFPVSGPPIRRNLTPAQASAWRSQVLYFDEARLGDVLSEVNRYARKPLALRSDDITHLRLTGQFRTGDTRELLFVLKELFGIQAQDTNDRLELYQPPSP